MSTMFSWREVTPAPGEPVAPDERLPVGQDGRARRPARGGDVRRHLRVPAGDGSRPQPGDPVLGDLHDPVPADHRRTGCRAISAPARRSWPASPRSAAQGGDSADVTGVDPGGRPRARRWSASWSTSPGSGVIHKVLPPAVTGAVVMLIGFNLAPGRRRHLLAAGPVDRAGHRDVHGLRRRAAARLLGADRRVPRPGLRLPALLAGRPALRPDPLGHRRRPATARRSTTTGSAGPG